MENIKKAGEMLSALFREQFDPETLENARISTELFSSSWPVAAKKTGIPSASDHCRIRELERGILVIEAEHPGWVQILQTKQKNLLELFQREFPELKIQGLSFCLSRDPISRAAAPAGQSNPDFGPYRSAGNNAADDSETSADQSVNEAINKFKKVIQNRNRKMTDSSV